MKNNPPANLSVYNEGSGDDFPVLKAFQQYIDAEQAKARRRLLTVSVVFVFMLIVVIGIFSGLVIRANNRTQALNDKLLEIALKDKERSLDEAKAAALQQQSVRNLNDTLEKLQRRIDDQNRSLDAASAEVPETASKTPASSLPETEAEKRAREAEARVQKALALLRAEKQKMADEKQKQREEELERYRREHYPEYYAKKEAEKHRPALDRLEEELDEEVSYFEEPPKAAAPSARPIDEEVSYFDDDELPPEPPAVKPVKAMPRNLDLDDDAEPVSYFDDSEEETAAPAPVAKPVEKPAKPDKVDEAIDYFDSLDSLTIPAGDGKEESAGWSIPLD